MSSHTAVAGDNQIKLLDRFEILLDNQEEVYFAGPEITGKVSEFTFKMYIVLNK